MNVLEIIAELKAGKTVIIDAVHSMDFIRECERHGETSIEIAMDIDWPKCNLSAPAYQSANKAIECLSISDKAQHGPASETK